MLYSKSGNVQWRPGPSTEATRSHEHDRNERPLMGGQHVAPRAMIGSPRIPAA
jgi:hypothetical protein